MGRLTVVTLKQSLRRMSNVPITSTIVAPLRRSVRAARTAATVTRLRGDAVECPLCGGAFSKFLPLKERVNAMCPRCGSLERHREGWLVLREQTNLFSGDPLRVLHVAPEPSMESLLRKLPNLDYITGDLLTGGTDMVLDLTAIDAPDDSFDVILCSHVLEHIPDDRQAMREMRRVLRPGGFAYNVVPVDPNRAVTYEDPSITTEAGRLKAFGQADHVRWYAGPDFEQRLRDSGWTVDRARVGGDRDRYALDGSHVADWGVICR